MSFLNPFLLIALVAVGVPLVIHLINLKKPTRVPFSTLAFFEQLQASTIRKIKIKKWLLLLLRFLAVASLALVLARPFLPPGMGGTGNEGDPSLNIVLIDNSLSMERVGRDGPLFEYAKNIAFRISEIAGEDDRFVLQVTNGEEEPGGLISKNNFEQRLNNIESSPGGNYVKNRMESLLEFASESAFNNKKLYLITDAQESQLDFPEDTDLERFNTSVTIIDAGDIDVQNTVITSVESSTTMLGSGIPINITVTLENRSEIPVANQFISLDFDGAPSGQYSVSLSAGEKRAYSFEVSPSRTGSFKGFVEIEGDEFAEDNQYYFALRVPEVRNVLWVKEKNSNRDFSSYTGLVLEVARENNAQLNYDEISPDELVNTTLTSYRAIILDGLNEVPEFMFEAFEDFTQSGNGLLFFPSENGNINNYNTFLSRLSMGRYQGIAGEYASFNPVAQVNTLLEDHPAFSGLFDIEENEELRFQNPAVYYYLRYQPPTGSGGFSLMNLNNGDPLIFERNFGEGKIVVSAIGNTPGWSDFPVQPLFAPTYYRIMLYAASSDRGGFQSHTLGEPFVWIGEIDPENARLEIQDLNIRPEVSVVSSGIQLSYPAKEWNPGWVEVNDQEHSYLVAVNNDRNEFNFFEGEEGEKLQENTLISEADYINAGEISEQELQSDIQSTGFGKEIWHWFMMAGLLFLMTESLVSVFFKAESN